MSCVYLLLRNLIERNMKHPENAPIRSQQYCRDAHIFFLHWAIMPLPHISQDPLLIVSESSSSIVFPRPRSLLYCFKQSARPPFDNVEAEAELVSGHMTEYSSSIFFYLHMLLFYFFLLQLLFYSTTCIFYKHFRLLVYSTSSSLLSVLATTISYPHYYTNDHLLTVLYQRCTLKNLFGMRLVLYHKQSHVTCTFLRTGSRSTPLLFYKQFLVDTCIVLLLTVIHRMC
ncbi:hypothetical protein METBIDRAFT_197098 [Metschnikowia bicuspidata var. bicuspidata NRRL YB-4993]|uniref:Uncharacterized protein n=1 Tax=Metschnikowia bicuspidata var. bicuspidata NRRL YB-4993 TaxID=869754 RepID=A0A1A0H900_9ASCO|nr:hypothetical protein METBIDRAFT_197098 [Metschnikowia bicuspidata var. bicuspidata NRRL YB-4993]OBA20358.1 hypothetical protein METBIDRAFT_197098 [Metschnikowia bicuspidata var. bicuspidata NRRL YB-4993]